MPSTHSANCISAALFLYSVASTLEISWINRIAINSALVAYASSVVLGRIYCGMHSISDCIVGGTIGVVTWVLIKSLEDTIESWLVNPSYGGDIAFPDIIFSLQPLNVTLQCLQQSSGCVSTLTLEDDPKTHTDSFEK